MNFETQFEGRHYRVRVCIDSRTTEAHSTLTSMQPLIKEGVLDDARRRAHELHQRIELCFPAVLKDA